MLKERARLVAVGLRLGDLASVSLAFLAAYYLRASSIGLFDGPVHELGDYLIFLLVGAILWAICLTSVGAYASHRTASLLAETWEILKATGFAGLLFIVLVFVTKLDARLLDGDRISRALVILWFVLAAAFLTLERTLVRTVARSVRRNGHNYRNIIIVGTSELGRNVARQILDHGDWGLKVLGFIHESPEDPRQEVEGLPVLGTWDLLIPVTESAVVD